MSTYGWSEMTEEEAAIMEQGRKERARMRRLAKEGS